MVQETVCIFGVSRELQCNNCDMLCYNNLEETRNAYRILVGKRERKGLHLEDGGIDKRIILKCILKG
jgi:hypothetical protein